MTEFLLSSYVLVWPVVSAAVLFVLMVALVKDMRAALKDGDSMI